ncbi:hypothetical protein AGMMS49593_09230 [Endomicrobiia bacterium]|nr:hypothetical protein AGMMS49593_09230 [Endomicrobiia bacterium]
MDKAVSRSFCYKAVEACREACELNVDAMMASRVVGVADMMRSVNKRFGIRGMNDAWETTLKLAKEALAGCGAG